MYADQSSFAIRFEWGCHGLEAVAAGCDVIVVVDVLSFSTCVDIAVGRGAIVLPYRWNDESANRFAIEQSAVLAAKGRVRAGAYSLSPASLAAIPPHTRLVLPSPNGATVSLQAAAYGTTVAACLRNCAAIAEFARRTGRTMAVIGCGEQWDDGSLRPAWEDLMCAGAVIARLPGQRSPEAQAACDVFQQAESELPRRLRECASGRELIQRGFAEDLELAAAYCVSTCVPILERGAFVAARVSSGEAAISEFGAAIPDTVYTLRPGGYAVIVSAASEVAVVSTPLGLMLPGGGQDAGESPEEAAIREAGEECGFKIVLRERIGVADELVFAAEERTHFRKRGTFFVADLAGRCEASEPDHEVIWLKTDEAQRRLYHHSHRWAVSEACRRKC